MIGEKDGGWYFKWKVFTKNGSVKDLILDNKTIGIHFVKEVILSSDKSLHIISVVSLQVSFDSLFNAR